MNRDLAIAATAIYGPRWQSELSRHLGVNDRTVRYWVAGRQVPDGVLAALAEAYADRALAVMSNLGMGGQPMALAVYENDEDLKRITGDEWSAAFHTRIMQRVAEKTGSSLVTVRADEYFAWLEGSGQENTPAARTAYGRRVNG